MRTFDLNSFSLLIKLDGEIYGNELMFICDQVKEQLSNSKRSTQSKQQTSILFDQLSYLPYPCKNKILLL